MGGGCPFVPKPSKNLNYSRNEGERRMGGKPKEGGRLKYSEDAGVRVAMPVCLTWEPQSPPPPPSTPLGRRSAPLSPTRLFSTHATKIVNAPFFQRRSQSRTNRRRNRERERKGREEGRENKKEATKEAKTEENRRRCKKECDQAAHPELAVKTWELLRNLGKGASLELYHVRLSQGVKA